MSKKKKEKRMREFGCVIKGSNAVKGETRIVVTITGEISDKLVVKEVHRLCSDIMGYLSYQENIGVILMNQSAQFSEET